MDLDEKTRAARVIGTQEAKILVSCSFLLEAILGPFQNSGSVLE